MPRQLTFDERQKGPRCEAMENPGVWPYAKRCENLATHETEEGSRYCENHRGWDDNDV